MQVQVSHGRHATRCDHKVVVRQVDFPQMKSYSVTLAVPAIRTSRINVQGRHLGIVPRQMISETAKPVMRPVFCTTMDVHTQIAPFKRSGTFLTSFHYLLCSLDDEQRYLVAVAAE